ncbi:SOS response-associated peptidase family protein [Pseudorhodoplanes sinuspersici]|uniref:SOS response-associated peptidase family protein n=1 Tax=Pseudorhodoplanes sinuspersici TaxID=1235591 RepID=UPI000A32152D
MIRRSPETGERTLDALSWGLIPHWALDPDIRPINATAEHVAAAPIKAAYAKRRCIVPMDGFWAAVPRQKRLQPYYITAKDRTSGKTGRTRQRANGLELSPSSPASRMNFARRSMIGCQSY